jgi:anti-sigma B factor antagonist
MAVPGEPERQATKTLFCSTHRDNVHVIMFSRADVLDAHYIRQLGEELCEFVKALDEPRVVVDMENVTFMSSAALGVLVLVRKIVRERGGAIRLANVRGDLAGVFHLTHMDKLFEFHDSRDAAVESLG